MELRRLLRVLRSRWGIVALISLVGFASAFGLTAFATGDVDPVFQATIGVQYELQEGETVEDLAKEIDTERGIAVFAAQDLLAKYPGSSIFGESGSARLVFTAQGFSSEEAVGRTQELVRAYLESDPGSGGDISGKLTELERQAVEIQGQIDALQPDLTPEEQALKNQHDLLDGQIIRIREEILNLTVADAGSSSEEQAQNSQRIADLEAQLAQLQTEKRSLPPAPSDELGPVEALKLDSLTRILEFLKIEYQQYSMRRFGITSTGGTVQPVSVDDLTPAPPNPLTNGAIGLLGGAGIALIALVLVTRARREVWLQSDVPMPTLGWVPRRMSTGFSGPSWYDASLGGARKDSVQTLRSAIEGSLDGSGSMLAILADRVEPEECRMLAADIAGAFASSGQSVLLVDADYMSRTETPEFNVGEPSLESFLRLPGTSKSLPEQVSGLLDQAIQIRPGLTVIPSGAAPVSPADALAASQFRVLLEQARGTWDLVLVVAGTSRSPSAQVISQRVGAALVEIVPGRTTIPSLESLVNELLTQRVVTIGAVMVSGRDAHGVARLPLPSWARSSDLPLRTQSERIDPVSRLRFYPSPMEKGSHPSGETSLRSLVGDLSESKGQSEGIVEPRDDGLASDLVTALSDSDRAEAYQPVAQYVVARVEDLLTAVSGQENLSRALVEVAVQDAYIPLTSVRGHRTVGEWLVEELRWELGDEDGVRIAGEFARILNAADGDEPAATLNWWLAGEFFPRHIERTQGEPEVWHLASGAGTLQVLIYGRRLTRERLDRFSKNVVWRAIDELQRRLEQARQDDEVKEAERLEEGLRDLHLFEVALGMLQVGSSEESRIYYPWRRHDEQPRGWAPIWAEGIRPNIAPLQRLGLLAHPVLSDDDLVTIHSAV